MANRDPDVERRKLFRRMHWVFVYAPPILAVFFATLGGLLLAFLFPLEDTTVVQRWALGSLLMLAVPGLLYFIVEKLRR
jgi:hypothetical protein